MPDALLDRLLANREAFVAFVTGRVESRAVAEDLVQDSLARAVERTDDLRDPEAAVGWFYQILRNAVIDHHRRRGAASRAADRLAAETPVAEEAEGPPRNPCKCALRLARALKPEYADALQKVEIDGASVKAFGEQAGISSGNAAVRVFRAREALRKKVVTTCGACAAAGCTDCDCVAPDPS